MCGIAGFNWADEAKIKSMMNLMKHRGPDDSGHYVDDNISLGHQRLSILDLSMAGHQPMFDDKKELAIVHNGEIYNFKEIRDELILKGHKFSSETDTEVIIQAYREWGPNCILRFNGIFAFVIYDIKSKKLFIARDHVGIKPLYYYHDKGKFIFSSTIEPILEHGVLREPNRKMIRDFLLYSITDHTDETFFNGINRFPKGHYGIFDLESKKLKITRWWINKYTGEYKKSYESAVEELRNEITSAINRQMISDVPVGVCLSGGIDSSTIALLINKQENVRLKSFSAVFPGFEKDETKYIDKVASNGKLDNYKIKPTAETMRADLERIVKDMAEPVPSPSMHSQYKVFDIANQNGVTVLLNGEGADEMLAGYHYFFGFYLKGLLKKHEFKIFFRELKALRNGGHSKFAMQSLAFLYMPMSSRRKHFMKKSNISKELLSDRKSVTSYFDDYYSTANLHGALQFHLDFKLEHLLKWEDRPSMAYSKEARVPFLDVNVMRLIFKLPENFIISEGRTKSVLRDAMRNTLPEEILNRKDKVGFDTPEDDWLRDERFVKLLNDWFISAKPLCQKYIDMKKTAMFINEHLNNKKNHGRAIWKTIFLETWLRVFFQ